MLGDVAVRYPYAGSGDVEQDVYGFSRAQEHGVLPQRLDSRFLSLEKMRKRPPPWKGGASDDRSPSR